MTTAKITIRKEQWPETCLIAETVLVRVMAVVDGWAMVHRLDHPKHPFVVYKCDLKDIKESFTEMMVRAGREG